jgi:hypothetical protein
MTLVYDGYLKCKGEPSKDDVLIVLGKAISDAEKGFGCNNCNHRTNECDLEYSSADWPNCEHPDVKIACRANLKSFPFKNAPKDCFSIHADMHAFVHIEPLYHFGKYDVEPGRWRITRRLWRRTDRFGLIKLKSENEAKVRKAYADFCERTGYRCDHDQS